MSFQIFKTNMLRYMQNPSNINSYQEFAKKLTMEYDMTIRRGYQTLNQVMLLKPNTELMQIQVELACAIALQKQSGLHGVINDIGHGVVGYWIGSTLQNFPPPTIPAIGSVLNISSTSAMVTNPGKFPDLGLQSPVMDSGLFLDVLIIGMQIHLTTVTGTYMTVSLYPGIPAMVAPGVLTWTGWTVPPSPKSPPIPKTEIETPEEMETKVAELLKTIPDDNVTVAGAAKVVEQTGVHILDDDGGDGGPVIRSIKQALPADKSQPELSEPDEVVPEENKAETKTTECGDDFDYNKKLSKSLWVRSLSLETTFPHKIKSQHGISKEDIVCNLESLAVNIIQPIKDKYPNIRINSAFRGTPSIPGRISQHEIGEAVDIQFDGLSPRDYLPISKWIVENLPVDQFIFEHGNSIWLHISHKKNGGNRNQKLTMYKGSYKGGIKCHYA